METRPKGAFADLGEEGGRKELVAFADHTLIPLEAEHGMHLPHAFLGDDGDGRARYLHIGRAMPRAGGWPTGHIDSSLSTKNGRVLLYASTNPAVSPDGSLLGSP